VETVQDTLGQGTALAGFYSYGEICPVEFDDKKAELHNQTMTITTLNSFHFRKYPPVFIWQVVDISYEIQIINQKRMKGNNPLLTGLHRLVGFILFLFDINETDCMEVREKLEAFRRQLGEAEMDAKHFIMVANKIDQLVGAPKYLKEMIESGCVFVSAKRKENIHMISESLMEAVALDPEEDGVIVSNARHYEALTGVLEAIQSIDEGFENQIPSDLIAIDIRKALHHLGEITGEITNDELLGNIFSRFCIGK